MKLLLTNRYLNRYIRISNLNDLKIIQTGSGPEQGIGDTREWWIIYTTIIEPKKENKIKYDPSWDELIIWDK